MRKKLTRRYLPSLIAIIIIIVFIVGWSAMWYAIGYHNSKLDTTEKLTKEFDERMQAYIDEMNYVPEDYERTQAIEELTDYMDELIAGYSMNSNINLEGKYAIGWCFIARYVTKGPFGTTVDEILTKPNQWQWYNADNPVRDQDIAIARAVATAYVDKHFPDDYTTNLCFADLKADGSVVLRDQLYTAGNDSVKYWHYKMG